MTGEGNGSPLQYSCLENPTDRGAWWAPKGKIESMGLQRDRHDWTTKHTPHTHMTWQKSLFQMPQKLGSGDKEERVPRQHSGKETASQWSRHRAPVLNLWVQKSHWRRKWQPTPVFLPEKLHGQKILVGFIPWGLEELDSAEQLWRQ